MLNDKLSTIIQDDIHSQEKTNGFLLHFILFKSLLKSLSKYIT